MIEQQPKFLIVDQSLRDHDGHHCDMDVQVTRAAAKAGLSPLVVANRRCRIDVPGATTQPWFSESWTEAMHTGAGKAARIVLRAVPPGLRATAAGLAANVKRSLKSTTPTTAKARFGAETVAAIEIFDLAEGDHVFVHTFSGRELHALISALPNLPTLPHVHLVFRREPSEHVMNAGVAGGLARIFSVIASDVRLSPKLRGYTDTEALSAEYRQIGAGLRFATLPIPAAPVTAAEADTPRAPGPTRLVYLGNARTEKGFHLLPALADVLREREYELGEVRLIAQANSGFSLDEHVITTAKRRLRAHAPARVKLLNAPLDEGDYRRLLLSADVVLLPYDARSYRRRSSGILIQALAAGRPVVAPSGTWLSQTAPVASCVSFDGEADFVRAALDAVRMRDALRAAAQADAARWRGAHNADVLMQVLLSEAKRTPHDAPQ